MTFTELCDFVANRMRMSHIYQPLLIRCLVNAGGSATIRQLAQEFAINDESEIQQYEKTIRAKPLRILTKHRVVSRSDDLVSLSARRLTSEQRVKVGKLCEERIAGFMKERGLKICSYRMMDDPVPPSLRHTVLKAHDRRCALCGATAKADRLDLDHIKPRSQGGTTTPENLQVLCAECKQAKSNKDATDFRPDPRESDFDATCPFCDRSLQDGAVETSGTVFAVQDASPATKGHLLIIPRRHTPDFFSMTEAERHDANTLLRLMRGRLQGEDRTIAGFNVGANCGEAAGQTIPHAHIHLIPRRRGDTKAKKRGVRGVIMQNMSH
jgi:diadenosine tetraphosphate (Ap4A) HIT family hydrolase